MVAGVLFALAGTLLWATYKNPTHAVTIGLPGPTYFNLPQRDPSTETVVNVVSPQEDGTIEWNGEVVTEEQLWNQIIYSLTHQVEPGLVFAPEPEASYELTLKVIALVRRSGVTKFCFAELEEHRHFNTGGLPNLLVTRFPVESTVLLEIDPIEPLPTPPTCSIPDERYMLAQPLW